MLISTGEIFYRFDLRAERDPRLESGSAWALRTPLADLIADRDILRQRRRRVASFGGSCQGVSAAGRPQPSAQPGLSDLAGRWWKQSLCAERGRSSICPQHLPPKEATPLLSCRRMQQSLSGRPDVFEATAGFRIRVRDRVRHKGRNDQILLLPKNGKRTSPELI